MTIYTFFLTPDIPQFFRHFEIPKIPSSPPLYHPPSEEDSPSPRSLLLCRTFLEKKWTGAAQQLHEAIYDHSSEEERAREWEIRWRMRKRKTKMRKAVGGDTWGEKKRWEKNDKKKKKDVGIYRDRFPYCKIYTTHFFNIKTSFHKIWGGGELHLQKLSVMYSYMIEPNNCSKWFLIGHPPILWLANFSELNGPNTFTVHWFSS